MNLCVLMCTNVLMCLQTNKLQDPIHRDTIKCDAYLQSIFDTPTLKFSDIPFKLNHLFQQPEPIVIEHIVAVDPGETKSVTHWDIKYVLVCDVCV